MVSTFTTKHAICALAISVSLAACATAAQRQYQTMVTNDKSAVQDLQSCSMAIYNSPEFAPLREHLPSNVTQATLEQLSDNRLATDGEIKIILAVHPQLQACRKQALDRISQSTPTLVPILLATLTKNEDSLIDLIQKKQSWGTYVRGVRDRAVAQNAELQAEIRRIEAGLQQSHEAELAQRQRAAEALSQWAQTQQMLNAANRPVITNCNQIGGMVNCVSR
jgi:hypothetical protein